MSRGTVLITGCTKGSIGYSLAKEFAAQDYHVFATTRKIASMDDLSTIPNITVLPLDITSRESVLSAHSIISKQTGGQLNILYHNAGYRSLGMAIESSVDEAFKMFNANLFGILLVNSIFADMIIKSKGKIVFTGSVSGYTPHPSQSVYIASKAAVELYAKTLRTEMKPFGVRVVFVLTAAVRTGMSSERVMLAENSNYRYLESKINKAWEDLERDGMSPSDYARQVVAKVIRTSPPNEIWSGSGATTVLIIEKLGIRWVYDFVFSRMFGLNVMAPSLEKDVKGS
ncbi:NAD(P)-binding protein [Hyaloscypha variabilis]|uniref:NAD(P)-binding protein n=1 Tax=Hyaloscypha variabilis (strain UAMH 11265 / GT02V1 / F) TaxID=1149755 RepID=A0A2J6RRX3_HYAVF|nr:NAD(P)-binding protein [Hyaloscypha variabilis F]